jgi:hypothetical protein
MADYCYSLISIAEIITLDKRQKLNAAIGMSKMAPEVPGYIMFLATFALSTSTQISVHYLYSRLLTSSALHL